MGAALRDRRGASPGASRLQGDLQPDLDHRAARLQDAGPGPLRSARPGADGRISANWCLTTADRYKVAGARPAHGKITVRRTGLAISQNLTSPRGARGREGGVIAE